MRCPRLHQDAFDALGEEFDIARALIEARTAAGPSQSQLAEAMRTSQSYIVRVEGGKVRPSTEALERFAQATRTRLGIVFEPCLTLIRAWRGRFDSCLRSRSKRRQVVDGAGL